MPSWRAIASAVTAWSPVIIRTWMPAAWALRDRVARLGARRVDDADEGQQLEVADQRQQVGVRVERGRVEVALRGGHDPQALGAEALVLGQVRLADLVDRVRRVPSGPMAPRWPGPAAGPARP